MPDYVVGSLRQLNKLRNRIAHRYEADVSTDEIRKLFDGLEHELPYVALEEHGDLNVLLRYSAFIFGNMLPKYERINEFYF